MYTQIDLIREVRLGLNKAVRDHNALVRKTPDLDDFQRSRLYPVPEGYLCNIAENICDKYHYASALNLLSRHHDMEEQKVIFQANVSREIHGARTMGNYLHEKYGYGSKKITFEVRTRARRYLLDKLEKRAKKELGQV